MTTRQRTSFHKTASTLLGAFFLLLCISSCKDKDSTADWEQAPPAEQAAENTAEHAAESTPAVTAEPDKEAAQATPAADTAPVRFLAYNLKNYLTMPRYINGKRTSAPKPAGETGALVGIIADARPDILGICEIGSPDDLRDLQGRLKAKGIDLPHAHHLLGYDSVRTLAILSKYPVVSTGKPEKDGYTVGQRQFRMSRGILDATIQLPGKQVRFVGVHLKSKRPIPEADQELMRRAESGLLRNHVNQILRDKPGTLLLVFGDFNDTKRTPALRTAMGRLNSKTGLIVLNAKDSRGDLWTHHWGREDIYSRFDFVMASKSLAPSIGRDSARILDPPDWEKASDHRAILVPIR